MITQSHPAPEVQRQQTEPRKMLTVPMSETLALGLCNQAEFEDIS